MAKSIYIHIIISQPCEERKLCVPMYMHGAPFVSKIQKLVNRLHACRSRSISSRSVNRFTQHEAIRCTGSSECRALSSVLFCCLVTNCACAFCTNCSTRGGPSPRDGVGQWAKPGLGRTIATEGNQT